MTYELTYLVLKTVLLSLRPSLLYFALYKNSEILDLVKNDFDSLINLGLSFVRVVGTYNIYTEFSPWYFV